VLVTGGVHTLRVQILQRLLRYASHLVPGVAAMWPQVIETMPLLLTLRQALAAVGGPDSAMCQEVGKCILKLAKCVCARPLSRHGDPCVLCGVVDIRVSGVSVSVWRGLVLLPNQGSPWSF